MRPLLALFAVLQAPTSPPASVDSAHVVLVATTDVHGHVLGWDYAKDQAAPGGLSREATILESLRARYPNQVVVVDAGDALAGDAFATYFAQVRPRHPHPIVDAYNALNADAATPGDHDFDFGWPLLRDAAADAAYPFVSANIVRAGGDSLLFPAVAVLQRGGVRVAITGLTTPGVMVRDRGVLAGAAIQVRSIAAAAPAALRALDQAHADLKIVLVHSGLSGPSSYDTAGVGAENDAARLATLGPRPDIVVVGHSHREMRDSSVAGVHFVQPKDGAQSLSVVHVWFSRAPGDSVRGIPPGPWRIADIRAELVPLATVPELPRFRQRLGEAHEQVRAWAATLPTFAPAQPREGPLAVATHDTTLLRILSINDLHGALLSKTWGWSQGRAVGGAAVLKTWLDSLAADCGCTSVRLDAGDEMQGTPISNFTFGRASIAVLNALGIDAAAVGNHEFDWSVDTLRARMSEARYQFVAANLTDSAGAIPSWVEPWTVVSRDRVKVAVIGIASPSTPTTTDPRNVRGLVFGDPAAAVRRVLPRVRGAADFVVVLAHAGAVCDSAGCHGEVVDLANGLDSGSVDAIIGGDTHRIVHTVIHGIPVVEAGSSGSGIGVVDIVRVGGGTAREVRTRVETPYADQATPNAALATSVDRARRLVDSITSRTVATLQVSLARNGDEYGLGRLIADAYRNMGKADVGLINNGGIRADLPGGAVSYGALFEVSPFQNRLVRITLSGSDLKRVLEHALAGGTPAAHVGGIEVWYDPRKPAGKRITKTRLINGRSLDDQRGYTIAVPDFLADGGSGYDMLNGRPRTDVGLVDLDALIAYLSVIRSPVVAPTDIRFHQAGH